jgi:hypothetical protein
MVKLISSWVCATSLFLLDLRAKLWQIMCNKWKLYTQFLFKMFLFCKWGSKKGWRLKRGPKGRMKIRITNIYITFFVYKQGCWIDVHRCEEKMSWLMKLLNLIIWIFSLIIFNEVTIQSVIPLHKHGSCTLPVHFVVKWFSKQFKRGHIDWVVPLIKILPK